MRGSVVGEGEISRNPLRCLAGYEIRCSPWMPPIGLWLERIDQLDAGACKVCNVARDHRHSMLQSGGRDHGVTVGLRIRHVQRRT